ncbi:amino acid permease, partial [Francisella tularensis subsp. holarctica]|nr:amino acid permease [Francisella tularensis subsp. holarctica]
LVLTLFNDEIRGAFYFGAPEMIIPCCIYFFVSKKKNTNIVQRTISLKKVF